jgi:hypothetical protein
VLRVEEVGEEEEREGRRMLRRAWISGKAGFRKPGNERTIPASVDRI